MKLEQQVVSLEIAKRLKELGVKQESLFYWRLGYSTSEHFDKGVSTGKVGEFGDYKLEYSPHPRYRTADVKWNERDLAKLDETELSAFTVAELLDLLPASTSIVKKTDLPTKTKVRYYAETFEYYNKDWYGENPTDSLGKMLIYLLENNLIK